jgi:REP element-mobilizing transposase RayT
VSLLHAHLVFVTKYRRKLFTGAMLTYTEHTMRGVCADLDVELVEFNGGADHIHLLAPIRPHSPYPFSSNASKAARLTPFVGNSPAHVCVPACAATAGRRPTSLSPAEAHPYRSSSNTSTDNPDHSYLRATPGNTRDGVTPP